MANSNKSLGLLVLNIAMAIFLIVSGILTLQLDSSFLGQIQASFSGNEVASAVYSIFKGDLRNLANPIIIILGICEIIAGAFIILNMFVDTGNIKSIFLLVIMIVWIVVIVLVDVLGKNGICGDAFKSTKNVLAFFKSLSAHLMVLGAILSVSKKN